MIIISMMMTMTTIVEFVSNVEWTYLWNYDYAWHKFVFFFSVRFLSAARPDTHMSVFGLTQRLRKPQERRNLFYFFCISITSSYNNHNNHNNNDEKKENQNKQTEYHQAGGWAAWGHTRHTQEIWRTQRRKKFGRRRWNIKFFFLNKRII